MKRAQTGFTLITAIFLLVVVAALVIYITNFRVVQQTTLLYGVQGARESSGAQRHRMGHSPIDRQRQLRCFQQYYPCRVYWLRHRGRMQPQHPFRRRSDAHPYLQPEIGRQQRYLRQPRLRPAPDSGDRFDRSAVSAIQAESVASEMILDRLAKDAGAKSISSIEASVELDFFIIIQIVINQN